MDHEHVLIRLEKLRKDPISFGFLRMETDYSSGQEVIFLIHPKLGDFRIRCGPDWSSLKVDNMGTSNTQPQSTVYLHFDCSPYPYQILYAPHSKSLPNEEELKMNTVAIIVLIFGVEELASMKDSEDHPLGLSAHELASFF